MSSVEDLFLGTFLGGGLVGLDYQISQPGAPQLTQGVGPAGRIFYHVITPLAASTNNLATSQHLVANTALVMTAGTGVTATTNAPWGGNLTVYAADTQRGVQLISTANLSAVNFKIVGYDRYWNPLSSTIAGPNNNTVVSKKTYSYVTSVTPDTTDAGNNVTVGYADLFGMPFSVADAGYISNVGWAGNLGWDTGTFVPADTTSPATQSTGDTRGTYVPSSASNGSRLLCIAYHLIANQCGAAATQLKLFGVTNV